MAALCVKNKIEVRDLIYQMLMELRKFEIWVTKRRQHEIFQSLNNLLIIINW
jgi:hypothetical protein